MRLAIISSIVVFATLIAASPTPALTARGPSPPFTLWAGPADARNPMRPRRIDTYKKSSGDLTLAIYGTGVVSFVLGSNRKVYTDSISELLLTLVPGSAVPLLPRGSVLDTLLLSEEVASDVELQNSEYFQVQLMLNGEKHLTSTINGGRWYRCLDGWIQTIHHANQIPRCVEPLEIVLLVRDESFVD